MNGGACYSIAWQDSSGELSSLLCSSHREVNSIPSPLAVVWCMCGILVFYCYTWSETVVWSMHIHRIYARGEVNSRVVTALGSELKVLVRYPMSAANFPQSTHLAGSLWFHSELDKAWGDGYILQMEKVKRRHYSMKCSHVSMPLGESAPPNECPVVGVPFGESGHWTQRQTIYDVLGGITHSSVSLHLPGEKTLAAEE